MKKKTQNLLHRCLLFVEEELETREGAQLQVSDPYLSEPRALVKEVRATFKPKKKKTGKRHGVQS